MSFSIIAAVGKNRELGRDGKLIWHLPTDLAFFKKTTMGHPILMGRKTLESLPGILPGRKHYVVTRGQVDHPDRRLSATTGAGEREPARNDGPGDRCRRQDDNLTVIHDLAAFATRPHDGEIFVIGGGQIYTAMLPYADTLYLTEVDATDAAADTFFPEFDKAKFKREILGKDTENGLNYQFVKYTRK